MKFDGNEILQRVAADLGIDLSRLVAGSSFWAPKDEGVTVAKHPNVRRAKAGAGEKRRTIDRDGLTLDDNNVANKALKRALAHLGEFKNFAVCHIWPGSANDARYHTVLANLVLVPRALASLTDHNREIEKCLQYRAWELYQWHPDSAEQPSKPENYPENWRQPEESPIRTKKKSASSLATSAGGCSEKSLSITLVPAGKAEFAKAFIGKGKARIIVTYSDGRVKETNWTCKNFCVTSNVVKNIRSRKDFRRGRWQQLGIENVEIRVTDIGTDETALSKSETNF